MSFDYNIPLLSIVLFGVALLALLYILTLYAYRIRLVTRRRKADDVAVAEASDADLWPSVSVVVCAHNEAELLATTLPPILQQAYPGRFEVVVVNDGTANDTETLVTGLKLKYPNLYLTFAPEDSHNVSRRKLAITLGVKAAKGEIVVVTDAAMRVPSVQWLYTLVRPFVESPATEVVLGVNTIYLPEGRFGGRLLTLFDSVADTVAWLSSAITGHPYRGSGNNLAYKREVFFRNKGFSSALNLRAGDDDIFVNEITNGDNTRVQLAEEAIGVWGLDAGVRRHYKAYRSSHAFTGRNLPKYSRRVMALGEWLIWIACGCAVTGAVVAGVVNLFGWAVCAVILIALYVALAVLWHSAVKSLTGRKVWFSAPFMAAFRPLRNLKCNLTCGSRKYATYAWQ